jgi:oxygen-independent coproporphyrinogen III oxidase
MKYLDHYNVSCPRYTSYPTALQFKQSYTRSDYIKNALLSNNTKRPLSLYFHIPFCDTLCYYCGCNKIATKNKRRASDYLQYLHQEIALQAQLFDNSRKVKQLHWGGGTPTFITHQEMQDLMSLTRTYFNLYDDDSGEYAIEIDPRRITPDTIKYLRNLGFNRISIGIQDFNLKVQKAINRIQTEETTQKIVDSVRDNKFKSLSVDLIYGLPHQTISSFEETLVKIIHLDPDRISIFNFAYLPAKFPAQKRIQLLDLPSPEEKLEILNLSIHLLENAGYVYIGMDHFAKYQDELAIAQRNGTLYRNFQGYATQANCDLIGMGTTAISSIQNHYSQNVRTIEEYTNQIYSGNLAIDKGIAIDLDDQIRKAVILELICHFSLYFKSIETQFNINFMHYFQDELKQLDSFKKDCLLTINNSHILVTPKGRLLIRNICSVFDRYYCAKLHLHSKAI